MSISYDRTECDPLCLTREIQDFPVGNVSLREHQRKWSEGTDLKFHCAAWLDSPDLAEFLQSDASTLIDQTGHPLAWKKAEPDNFDTHTSRASFLIRYPWDFLTAQDQYFASWTPGDCPGKIHSAATIDGLVELGDGSRILPGVYIEGNVKIGADCKIGPNCYIRGNTSIADHCHIGQSVEIKNSLILSRTNVGHLSYVGDSILGEKVNLGAGTTVSNYRHDGGNHRSMVNGRLIDTGRRKLGAIFGDGVHTGINTSIYPGRKLWPGTTTLPAGVVQKDLQTVSKSSCVAS